MRRGLIWGFHRVNVLFCCRVHGLEETARTSIYGLKGEMWVRARQVVYCPHTESYLVSLESRQLDASPIGCPERPGHHGVLLEGWEFSHFKYCKGGKHSSWVELIELAYLPPVNKPDGMDRYSEEYQDLCDLHFRCITSTINANLMKPLTRSHSEYDQDGVVHTVKSIVVYPILGEPAMRRAAEIGLGK